MKYLEINKKFWNDKVNAHFNSEFYNVPAFLKGQNSLNEIELNLLGDLNNKDVLHLQCHFGQDSISLARLGGKVTGVDLSDKAIAKAKLLAKETGSNAKFINCDVYSLKDHLSETFDVIFTSYGTIGWLPDIRKWANIISTFLKPGGKLIFAEFHPVVWMFNEQLSKIEYSYFNVKEYMEDSSGSYTDNSEKTGGTSVFWNHSLSEVISALLNEGLHLSHFSEYDYSPYNCFENTTEVEKGKFCIKQYDRKLPMVYALVAEKINH